MTNAEIRARIVEYALWGCQHQPSIHYAQVRPIPHTKAALQRLPFATDCSGFATMAYQWAGAEDPNGNGYNGAGYTGTLLQHGTQIAHSTPDGKFVGKTPRPGDLIFFGDFPGHHVTIMEKTVRGAWLTISHGQEIGPAEILNHREWLAQRRNFEVRSYLS